MKLTEKLAKCFKTLIAASMVLTLISIDITTASAKTKGTGEDLVLYPVPRNMNFESGTLKLSNGVINSDDADLKAIDKIQSDAAIYAGVTLTKGNGSAIITLTKDDTLSEQGYSLVIDDNGIRISYKDEAGAYYAAVTLYQIMFQVKDELPYLTIENDHPDYQYRGFMVDISRNRMPKVETLKQVIDMGESLKMNQLFLYFESFSYAYSLEEVWAGTEPLTPEQAKEIDEYALSKGITVVPVQNSFGHSYAWVNKYPHLGDKPGSDVLNIFSDDTKNVLRMIYDDLAKGFSGEMLVICGDETHNIDPVNGEAAKAWKQLEQNAGKTPSATDLYVDSMDIINDIAGKEKGRQVMYWADMVVNHSAYDQINAAMDGAIIMDWGYNETYDFESHAVEFEKRNMPFYVCPGDNSWSTIVGNTRKTQLNAEHAALAGKNHGAIGYMMTNWGDYGHYQNIITQYPAIAYAGGLSWNYDDSITPEGASEMAYDAYLNTFIYQDTTNTLSQAFSKFANYTTDYGIGAFNESYLATAWTEGASNYTALNALIAAQTEVGSMDEKRDKALEDCANIAADADRFLTVLRNANMQANDADLLYQEFENTARQVKVATDFVSMRLRLYDQGGVTPLTTRDEEGDQAVINLASFQEMITQFQEIWLARDAKHLLQNTLYSISTPELFYNGIAGLENLYSPISEDNLFIITPETIDGQIKAENLVKGSNWANNGDKKPALVEIYIGDDSQATIQSALDKGLFKIVDHMDGVEGKVFIADTKVSNDNNYNLNGTMFPFLYFPGIVRNNGVYQATAKLKYRDGSPVDASTMLINGTLVDNLGNQMIIETRPDSVQEYSAADVNGWVTMTYTFTVDEGKAVALDFKPHGIARENGDALYINQLELKKVKDIIEEVEITSGHSKYNAISLGSVFEVPMAKSSGKEPITVELTMPDGTKSTVAMKDQVTADQKGVYRLVYQSDEAKAPLVIIFEVKNDIGNLLPITDETAQGFITTSPTGGIPLYNPYHPDTDGFNKDQNLIVWGEGAADANAFVELLNDADGGNGQVIHTFTKNLQGSHIPMINFSAEVEPGKTYVISSRLKLKRVNMVGFDTMALHYGEFYFSNENTDATGANYSQSEGPLQQYLTPENNATLHAGEWFYFSKTISVPQTCEQGGQELNTSAMRFWFSLSALPAEDMQYDLWIDDVAIVEVKDIVSIPSIADVEVEIGTKETDLNLPLTTSVTLNDGSEVERPVIWTCEDYDPLTSGTYTFKGEIGSNEVITNPNHLEATIRVIVKQKAHTLTHVAPKNPSCTEAGNIEYWVCEDCGQFFSDAAGNQEITKESTIVEALGHQLTHIAREEATETSVGNIEYWYCQRCNRYFADAACTIEITLADTLIPVKPENPENPDDTDQTETEMVDEIVSADNNVTIIGKFHEDVELIVKSLSEERKAEMISNITNQKAFEKYTFERIFDIYMMRKGVAYHPNGNVTIRIKLDQELITKRYLGIVYIPDENEATIIPSKVENGYITFETNHNSYYAIISSDSPITNTATGSTTTNAVPLVIMIGAAMILLNKKMEKIQGNEMH